MVVAPESSAAIKVGASCKKAGLINITGGFKYTCVKKIGKLVWGKGVAVKATPKASASATAGYTMAQVKANKSASKCWSVINEKVYDLTAWINSHPGGGSGAILSLCGIDGTQDFLAMHRNQSKPESRLSGYLLGPLAK